VSLGTFSSLVSSHGYNVGKPALKVRAMGYNSSWWLCAVMIRSMLEQYMPDAMTLSIKFIVLCNMKSALT
jgi:hypothetical protein